MVTSSQWQVIFQSNTRVSIFEVSVQVALVTSMVRTQTTVVGFFSCVSSNVFFKVMTAVGAVVTVRTCKGPVVMEVTDVLHQQESAGGGEPAHVAGVCGSSGREGARGGCHCAGD